MTNNTQNHKLLIKIKLFIHTSAFPHVPPEGFLKTFFYCYRGHYEAINNNQLSLLLLEFVQGWLIIMTALLVISLLAICSESQNYYFPLSYFIVLLTLCTQLNW